MEIYGIIILNCEVNFMKKLIIAIGSDHKGFEHKKSIIEHLKINGFEIIDFGPNTDTSVDYPDYAKGVCKAVQNNEANFGILICYTGIGMSIVANKYRGIRASLVGSIENAFLTRSHNDANVLCMGAKDTEISHAIEIVSTFLETEFEGGRHINRVEKIKEVEELEKR